MPWQQLGSGWCVTGLGQVRGRDPRGWWVPASTAESVAGAGDLRVGMYIITTGGIRPPGWLWMGLVWRLSRGGGGWAAWGGQIVWSSGMEAWQEEQEIWHGLTELQEGVRSLNRFSGPAHATQKGHCRAKLDDRHRGCRL